MTPKQLKVFDRLPADAINATVQESFLKPARIELPQAAGRDQGVVEGQARSRLHLALKEQVFRGWPTNPPPLNVKPAEDVKHKGCGCARTTSSARKRSNCGSGC